jgi:hypothetical protein
VHHQLRKKGKAMGGGRTPMAYILLLLSITEINREKYKI